MTNTTQTKTASLDAFMDRGRQLECSGGRGVPIKNYQPFSDFVLNKMVKKAKVV